MKLKTENLFIYFYLTVSLMFIFKFNLIFY